MAATVTLSANVTRMLVRGARGVVSLRLGGPAIGTSGFRRRFHISCVSQGMELLCYNAIIGLVLRFKYVDWLNH